MKVSLVQVLEEAFDDLDAGREFYERREEGVGEYFTASLLADLKSLRFLAGIHTRHHGYLRMLASRFPFAVYYEIVDDAARVVAVLDMRRDPASIRSILTHRERPQSERR